MLLFLCQFLLVGLELLEPKRYIHLHIQGPAVKNAISVSQLLNLQHMSPDDIVSAISTSLTNPSVELHLPPDSSFKKLVFAGKQDLQTSMTTSFHQTQYKENLALCTRLGNDAEKIRLLFCAANPKFVYSFIKIFQ